MDRMDYLQLKELVTKNRTYRRFDQSVPVTEEDLTSMVELARLSSFGGNRQSFKFLGVLEKEARAQVFKTLKWANYLKEWEGPEEGERPTAYLVILHDKDLANTYFWEHGLAAQSILLGAVAKGFGGCMFASFNRTDLSEILNLPENLIPLMVIALGKPGEEVVLENMDGTGNIEYWRDGEGRHHVPKRPLRDIFMIR